MISLGPNYRGIARKVSKRYPVGAQVRALHDAGLSIIYDESKSHGADTDLRGAWLNSLRPGDIAVVTWLGLLADPIGNVTVRRNDLKEVVEKIEENGASIWELQTDRRSSDKKQRDAMMADAWDGLAKQRFDRATRKQGRPPRVATDEEKQIIWDEWFNKKHKKNLDAARAATERLKRRINPHMMWRIVKEMRAAKGLKGPVGGSGRTAGRRFDLGRDWDDHNSQVYFLRVKGTDEVKIGYSVRLNKRVGEINVSHSRDLELIATVSGGIDAEGRLHRRFASYRIRGEWYRLEGKLAEYVKKLGKPKKPMR
jgi:hypothetical protein